MEGGGRKDFCGHDLVEFLVIIEARCTLSTLDITLGDEYEQSVMRFQQGRVAPAVVIALLTL